VGRVHPDLGLVVAVGLGQHGQGVDPLELIDLGKKGAHEEQKNYKAIVSCIGDHESLMIDGFTKPRPHPFTYLQSLHVYLASLDGLCSYLKGLDHEMDWIFVDMQGGIEAGFEIFQMLRL
jgi:hypothetical protein